MTGFITLASCALDGKPISTQAALDAGLINSSSSSPHLKSMRAEWGLDKHEIPIGSNLFLANGRQCLAYAVGNRAPLSNYVIASFGVGTGTTPAKATDVALEAPVTFSDGRLLKDVSGIDFPAPFIVRVEIELGINDANGYLITEWGLYSGDETLVARKVDLVGTNKQSSGFSSSYFWRIRT